MTRIFRLRDSAANVHKMRSPDGLQKTQLEEWVDSRARGRDPDVGANTANAHFPEFVIGRSSDIAQTSKRVCIFKPAVPAPSIRFEHPGSLAPAPQKRQHREVFVTSVPSREPS